MIALTQGCRDAAEPNSRGALDCSAFSDRASSGCVYVRAVVVGGDASTFISFADPADTARYGLLAQCATPAGCSEFVLVRWLTPETPPSDSVAVALVAQTAPASQLRTFARDTAIVRARLTRSPASTDTAVVQFELHSTP